MNNDYIIKPVDRKLIAQELNSERFVRNTNKAGNEIYVVNHHNSPNVMREIGRLREVTFAESGGGTGLEIDIDDFDTKENCYEQLIVYSQEDKEIISGYRFMDCSKVLDSNSGEIELSTAHYFNFSNQFIEDFLPNTIELGRSWVQPKYQPANNPRKGLFALDNLWDGLGAIAVTHPHIKYFFGKVTMYSDYNTEARDALLYFMDLFFPDSENLVVPINPLKSTTGLSEIKELLKDKDFKEGIKTLNQFVRARGENIPPLINSYMQLSATMKSFGTAANPDFGAVEETGILVKIEDIYTEKRERYLKY